MYTTGQGHVIQENSEPPRSATVIEKAADLSGVPWIHATQSLRLRADKLNLYYPQNGHWTATGHRAVAKLLCSKIVECELVSIRNVE